MNDHIGGPLVPQFNSRIRKFMGKLILFVHRWKIEGSISNTSKLVIALAPHTTYWDFISSIGTMLSLGLKTQWFIAKEFCWWPAGHFMMWLGGLPIDRKTRHNLVSKMVDKFNEDDEFFLSIYPEGTTYKTNKWKTGFWYIAKGANVSIQLVGLDYSKRTTIFGPTLKLSDNVESDMETIKKYFEDITPKFPEKFSC